MAERSKRGSHLLVDEAATIPAPAVPDTLPPRRVFGFHGDENTGLLCLLLFILVAAVFLPTLRGDFIQYDERQCVIENAHVNTGLTLGNIAWGLRSLDNCNWHPLTWWSYMVDGQLYGLIPAGYHLTNVVIHALSTMLVFLLLRKLTGAVWRSLIVAALFGLHPLRVESVAWISERKDVLSVMFCLLTFLAYAKYVEASGNQESKARVYYGLALAMFIAALMSKPMAVTVPLVLLILDYWPLARWKQKRVSYLLMEKLPFLLLAGAVSAVTFINQKQGGTMNELGGLPLGMRLETALVGYFCYLGKLFWPADLCALYPYPDHWPTGLVLMAGLILLGISVLSIVMRHQCPWFLAGWLWYLITLVPVIGLVQVGPQSMADRYTYLPCIGILIAVVWGLCEISRGWRYQVAGMGIATGLAVLICIVLAGRQISYWKDDVTVWKRAVEAAQNNYAARTRLGRALLAEKHLDEAITEFQEVERLRPGFMEGRYSLAGALFQKGRLDEAIVQYQKILEFPQSNPAWAHHYLGLAFSQKGDKDNAIYHLQKSLEFEPGNTTTRDDLAWSLLDKGQSEEAISQFQTALKGTFDDARESAAIHNDLGVAYFKNGQTGDAFREFQASLTQNPGAANVHHNLGWALRRQGELDRAILEFQVALRLNPGDGNSRSDLVFTIEMKKKSTGQPLNPTNVATSD